MTATLSGTASFNQHGHQFWDKTGPYRTLHHINPARLKFIQRFIALRGQNILDIGCGGGILSEALYRKGAHVTGIDLSPVVLDAARTHANEQGLAITYREISAHELAETGAQFDHITCMEMLEHVANPAAIFRDIERLLKPSGYAFLSTLNRTKKAWLGAIFAAEYLTNTVPRGTHNHEHFIRPDELVNMAEHAGLKAIALSGMDYHPLLKTAILSRKLDINYLLCVQKPHD